MLVRRSCPSSVCNRRQDPTRLQLKRTLICRANLSVAAPEAPTTPSNSAGQVKRMILLRHAESESRAGVRDHDRPLSKQGKAQAVEIARKIKESGWLPDLILASNAQRTKQTLDQMATVLHKISDVDAHYYGSLYTVAALDGQTRSHLQECLSEVVSDAQHKCVLLVGHNRGWEEAASSFAGCAIKLKTASAALLQATAGSWGDALKEDTKWQLVEVLTPSSPAASAT